MIFEGLEEGNVQRGEGRDRKGQRGDLLREARMRRGRKEGGNCFKEQEKCFSKHIPTGGYCICPVPAARLLR